MARLIYKILPYIASLAFCFGIGFVIVFGVGVASEPEKTILRTNEIMESRIPPHFRRL